MSATKPSTLVIPPRLSAKQAAALLVTIRERIEWACYSAEVIGDTENDMLKTEDALSTMDGRQALAPDEDEQEANEARMDALLMADRCALAGDDALMLMRGTVAAR